MMYIRPAAVIALALLLASCSNQKFKVDLVLTNGDIQTMSPGFPRAEAVAVDGGKIVGVGTTEGVQAHYDGKVTIDLQGAYVLPGLIDGHAHVLELGMSLQTVDLSGARSPQEVAKLVEEATAGARPGGWIRGGGWEDSSWSAEMSSVTGILDRAAPDNFVYLVSGDGRSVWVNGKVLELAGISKATKSPKGGLIVKDPKGNPTGILEGSAIGLVTQHIPPPSEHEIEDAILLASDTCARYGITEVQDAGIDGLTLSAYKTLAQQGKLRIRIYAMYDGNDSTLPGILEAGRIVDPNGYFTLRSVRVDMDGSLGSRQAALVREYSDSPGQFGATQLGEKDLENLTIASLSSGFQVCTEARGDRANDIALNAYQKALEAAAVRDPRLRIEGVDVLLSSDISRFKTLGVVPSMQPAKFASDMPWIESRLGPDRIRNTYAWRSLLDAGNTIIGGSDFPEENPDPRIGIYAAITRRDLNGLPQTFAEAAKYFQLTPDAARDSLEFNGGFFPQQRMTLADALNAFTVWPAYGAFQENEKGKIAVGFYADFTFLQKDLNKLPPGEIPYDAILGTIVGGRLVYISPLAADWRVL